MNEKPIERLNYYNGQRLEAKDLKLEQEYHIRMRRWLNKSLYIPGIAKGLGVRPEKDENGENTHRVIVSPGLAIDNEGREIILLEEKPLDVIGKGGSHEAVVEGNYLTIQYSEEKVAEEQVGCNIRAKDHENRSHLAWGGPARILAEPLLEWCDSIPHEGSGKIVLAQVEMDKGCKKVHQINTGVRRYVGAASAAKVHQYALEGYRDIDKGNPGRIYFHVRGRQPNAVTLYLRAEKFSTLYYTEMGQHRHSIGSTSVKIKATNSQHYHNFDLGALQTQQDGEHVTHTVTARGYEADLLGIVSGVTFGHIVIGKSLGGILVNDNLSLDSWVNMKVTAGAHGHNIVVAGDTKQTDPFSGHTHEVDVSSAASAGDTGITDVQARSGQALTYVNDLQVYIDGEDQTHNQTQDILNQLDDAQPNENWKTIKLGNGNANHTIVMKGTGQIKLDFLHGVSFAEGEHYIEFRVNKGGGRILYNLYVE